MILKELLQQTPLAKYVDDYLREIVIALGIFVVLSGGYYLYHSQKISAQEAAYRSLDQCLYDYNQARTSHDDWSDVEMACSLGYEQHQSTSLAPFFLAIHAQALIAQEKKKEALPFLEKLLLKLDNDSSFYASFAIKHALVQLDLPDMKEVGLQLLQRLAYDEKNTERDQALYYLGNHYLVTHQKQQARTTWQDLLAAFPERGLGGSPWADLVQARLEQL